MIKKAVAILLLSVLVVPLFTACTSQKEKQPQSGERTYADYIDVGALIAVEAGDVYGDVAREVFKAKVSNYNSSADMLEALRTGKVDGILISRNFARKIMSAGTHPDLDYLLIPY